jgi:hypothetical protein
LLKEIGGKDWSLKLSISDKLMPVETAPRAASVADGLGDAGRAYKEEPLIKEALELFQGKIRSATT